MDSGRSFEIETSDGPRRPPSETSLPPGVFLDTERDVAMASAAPAIMKLLWWTRMRWLAAGAALALALNGLLIAEQGPTSENITTLWLCIGLLVLIPGAMAVTAYTSRGPLRAGHLRFIARTDGYTLRGVSSSMTHRWDDFKKAYVDRHTIYLMLAGGSAQLIPLAYVDDPKPLIDHLKRLGLLRPAPKTFYFF